MASTSAEWVVSGGSTISVSPTGVPNVDYSSGTLILLPGALGNGLANEYSILSCLGTDVMPIANLNSFTLVSTGKRDLDVLKLYHLPPKAGYFFIHGCLRARQASRQYA